MKKNEIESRFIQFLLETGVTHADLERIVTAPCFAGVAKRLVVPYITLFVREASAYSKQSAT